MEDLDGSVRSDPKIHLFDPAKARKTLTRCCSTSSPPVSLVRDVGGVKKQSSESKDTAPVAPGTGVYFSSAPPNCSPNCCRSNGQLQKLFHLTTVACEIAQDSSLRHRQCRISVKCPGQYAHLVKKRRTPRSSLWINGSKFSKGGYNRGLPGAAIRPRIRNMTFWSPPWPDMSAQQAPSFALTSLNEKPTHGRSRNEVIKFVSQNPAGKRACQRPSDHKPVKGKSFPSAVSKPRAGKPPRLDTRVERFSKSVLQFIGKETIAEKFIRGALGNTPDTSKALRMLLRQNMLNRLGVGGRGKAFLYVATTAGLRWLEDLKLGKNSTEIDVERQVLKSSNSDLTGPD